MTKEYFDKLNELLDNTIFPPDWPNLEYSIIGPLEDIIEEDE